MTNRRLKQSISSGVIAVLACVFFAYHIFMTGFGVDSFIRAYTGAKPTSTPTPVVVVPATSQDQIVLGKQSQPGQWPSHVDMPSVGISLDLTGSMENQGQWYISTTGANFAINTAVPNGISGNTALFGHDRPGLFRNIHNLKFGDIVKVTASDKVYEYKVTWTQVVQPTDVSVMNQTRDPILTLITCDGWLSQERYVVVARLISPLDKPTPTPTGSQLASR